MIRENPGHCGITKAKRGHFYKKGVVIYILLIDQVIHEQRRTHWI